MSPYPGACLGFRGQVCNYYLGKALGGSTALNYMVYVRGNRHDFDRWERMGNYGWGFDDILPLFLKLENATGLWRHGEHLDTNYRGVSGELAISHVQYRPLVGEVAVEAAKERGLPFLDYNGRQQIGVDYTQSTTRNGRRFSAADAYLTPVKDRKNLHVMIESLVSKVIIDPETKMAEGVQFTHKGEIFRVFSKKEVILSAGPIMSPQLLMLSGVGPRRELRRFNIPVISDLPVGMKYLDHSSLSPISAVTNLVNETIDQMRITSEDIEDFVENGTGKLSIPAGDEVLLLYNNGLNGFPPENANTEFLFHTNKNALAPVAFSPLRPDVYNASFRWQEEESDEGILSLTVIDLYPQTQGRIRLRGNTINHLPIIDYPFFKDPRDIEALVWGAKEAVALFNTEAMKKIGAKLVTIPLPDCATLEFGSDDYWRCAVRHLARNILHAAATNKMGPPDDPEAVVDPELSVYGVGRLRVADSSVAPTTVACHTQAVSYVVGEKLAVLLKDQWKL